MNIPGPSSVPLRGTTPKTTVNSGGSASTALLAAAPAPVVSVAPQASGYAQGQSPKAPEQHEFFGTKPFRRTVFEVVAYEAAHAVLDAFGVTGRDAQHIGTMALGSTLIKTVDAVTNVSKVTADIAKHGLDMVLGRAAYDLATEPFTFGIEPKMAAGFGLNWLAEHLLPDNIAHAPGVGMGTMLAPMAANSLVNGMALRAERLGTIPMFAKDAVKHWLMDSAVGTGLRAVGSAAFAAELLDVGAWLTNRIKYGDARDAAGDFAAAVSNAYFSSRTSILNYLGLATDFRDVVLAGDIPVISWLTDHLESGPTSAAAIRETLHALRKSTGLEQVEIARRQLVEDAVRTGVGAAPTGEQLGRALAQGWLDDARLPDYARQYSHAHEAWYKDNIWMLQKLRLESPVIAEFVGLFTEAMRNATPETLREGTSIARDADLPATLQADVRFRKQVLVYRELVSRDVSGASLRPVANLSWEAVAERSPDFLTQARAHGLIDAQGHIVPSAAYFTAVKELAADATDSADMSQAVQLSSWAQQRVDQLRSGKGTNDARNIWLSDVAVVQPYLFVMAGDPASDAVAKTLDAAYLTNRVRSDANTVLRSIAYEGTNIAATLLLQRVQVYQASGMTEDAAYATVQRELQNAAEADPLLQACAGILRGAALADRRDTGAPDSGALRAMLAPVVAQQDAQLDAEVQKAQPIGDPDTGIGAAAVRRGHREHAVQSAATIVAAMRANIGSAAASAWADVVARGESSAAAMAIDIPWTPEVAVTVQSMNYVRHYRTADGASTNLPKLFWQLDGNGAVNNTAPLVRELWMDMWQRANAGDVAALQPFASALTEKLKTLRAERSALSNGSEAWRANNDAALNIRRMLHTIGTLGADVTPPSAPPAQAVASGQN